jgi:hypothetical protein
LSRLAGAALPVFAEADKSFADMRARVAFAHAHIRQLSRPAIDADPEGSVKVPTGPVERTFTRLAFLQTYILPNMYFHVTATYLILRHMGVDVGKPDFLNSPRPT